jgi:hypothetical protein
MLVIPLFGDQLANAARVERQGCGKVINIGGKSLVVICYMLGCLHKKYFSVVRPYFGRTYVGKAKNGCASAFWLCYNFSTYGRITVFLVVQLFSCRTTVLPLARHSFDSCEREIIFRLNRTLVRQWFKAPRPALKTKLCSRTDNVWTFSTCKLVDPNICRPNIRRPYKFSENSATEPAV